MLNVSVKGNKIILHSMDVEVISALEQFIGTAHQDAKNPTILRCRLSIPNFKRIRRLFPGAQLSKDEETKKAIEDLQNAQNAYANENEKIRSAKSGGENTDYVYRFTPYAHQRKGFNFMHAAPRTAIFGDCGVGKTAIVAAYLDFLVASNEINYDNPALIVCPISIIHQAWIKDIKKFTDLKPVSLYEPSCYKRKEKRADRLATKSNVYIASYSMLSRQEVQLRKKEFRFIAVDESTKIKNPQARSFRALMSIAWKSVYRYIMSGTPAPNGPLDLWSQFNFVDEGMTLEPSLVDFRQEHFTEIDLGSNRRIWRPKRGMTKVIYDKINPRSIRFKASECLDLPKKTSVVREVDMTAVQRKAYEEMAENLFVELSDTETVTARIAVTKLMKLREIAGGFVINDGGEVSSFSSNPKLVELDHLLDQILASEEHKAIIWIQYRWEAQTIINKYKKKYGAVGVYGAINQTQKDKNIDSFLENKNCRVLVCHPKSAGHGLTLNVAAYTIYYSLSHDFEEFYQSSKRNYRSGQTKPVFYYFLTAAQSIDQSLLICLQDKKNVQDMLIDGAISPDFLGIRDTRKGEVDNGERDLLRNV